MCVKLGRKGEIYEGGTKGRRQIGSWDEKRRMFVYAKYESRDALLKCENKYECTRIYWFFIQLWKKELLFAFQFDHVVGLVLVVLFDFQHTSGIQSEKTCTLDEYYATPPSDRRAQPESIRLDIFIVRKTLIAVRDFIYIR